MSNTITLHFKKPGLQTLVQDKGRSGQQAFGVPIGGVMDKSSARIANWLVGNSPQTPVLEIALLGPQIEVEGDCQIAITGANISPMIDGVPLNMYETVSVKRGFELTFGAIKEGSRAYLAIGGVWKVKKWLNSSSAFLLSEQNLTPDSCPVKGSVILINSSKSITNKVYPKELRPKFAKQIQISILPGPEFDDFSRSSIDDFLKRGHTITADSNRMGFRLGTTISGFDPKQEVISSGIVTGTIQITNSGQPVILMTDAQTTGGYPRIGNVITAHLDQLAQAKPGDEIWFTIIELKDAYQSLKDQEATLGLLLK